MKAPPTDSEILNNTWSNNEWCSGGGDTVHPNHERYVEERVLKQVRCFFCGRWFKPVAIFGKHNRSALPRHKKSLHTKLAD